jgi:hypothetical protein
MRTRWLQPPPVAPFPTVPLRSPARVPALSEPTIAATAAPRSPALAAPPLWNCALLTRRATPRQRMHGALPQRRAPAPVYAQRRATTWDCHGARCARWLRPPVLHSLRSLCCVRLQARVPALANTCASITATPRSSALATPTLVDACAADKATTPAARHTQYLPPATSSTRAPRLRPHLALTPQGVANDARIVVTDHAAVIATTVLLRPPVAALGATVPPPAKLHFGRWLWPSIWVVRAAQPEGDHPGGAAYTSPLCLQQHQAPRTVARTGTHATTWGRGVASSDTCPANG